MLWGQYLHNKNIFKTKVVYFWALKYHLTVTSEYNADLNNQTQSDLWGEKGVKCSSFYQKLLNHIKINLTVELCLLCPNSSSCTVNELT